MKKLIFSLSVMTFLAFTGVALADNSVYGGYGSYGIQNCQPVYGGGETCVTSNKILINKTIKNPQTGMYVDNLSLNNVRYSADQSISFQLTVTNTGNSSIPMTTVSDAFPNYITNITGPGTFNSKNKTLTFNVNNLNINESRTYTLSGKVVSADKLPSNQNVVCLLNQASVSVGSETSTDNSQFCIEKQAQVATTTKGGLPVYTPPSMSQTPATGPEMLPLLGMIPTALAGFALRRRSK